MNPIKAIYWRVYSAYDSLVLTTARVDPNDATAIGAREAVMLLKLHGYRVTRVTVR